MNKKVFSINEIHDIYKDPENLIEYLGRGRLIKYVRSSLPFIINSSTVSEDLNLHYIVEYWIISIKEKTCFRGIRRLYNIGQTSSGVSTREQMSIDASNTIGEDFKILPKEDTSFWDNRVTRSELKGSMY